MTRAWTHRPHRPAKTPIASGSRLAGRGRDFTPGPPSRCRSNRALGSPASAARLSRTLQGPGSYGATTTRAVALPSGVESRTKYASAAAILPEPAHFPEGSGVHRGVPRRGRRGRRPHCPGIPLRDRGGGGNRRAKPAGYNGWDVEAAGIEPENEAFSKLVTLRDFGRIGFRNKSLPPRLESAPVPPSPPESPLGVETYWRRRGQFPPPAWARRQQPNRSLH